MKAARIIRPKECLQIQHLESQSKNSQLRINVNSFRGGRYHRDKFDIILSILDAANGNEVKQIEILDRARIPHSIFKNYLSFIQQHGLIEYIQPQRIYRTTTKGIHFLSMANKLKADIIHHDPV